MLFYHLSLLLKHLHIKYDIMKTLQKEEWKGREGKKLGKEYQNKHKIQIKGSKTFSLIQINTKKESKKKIFLDFLHFSVNI